MSEIEHLRREVSELKAMVGEIHAGLEQVLPPIKELNVTRVAGQLQQGDKDALQSWNQARKGRRSKK
jgi:hypothetical protein